MFLCLVICVWCFGVEVDVVHCYLVLLDCLVVCVLGGCDSGCCSMLWVLLSFCCTVVGMFVLVYWFVVCTCCMCGGGVLCCVVFMLCLFGVDVGCIV